MGFQGSNRLSQPVKIVPSPKRFASFWISQTLSNTQNVTYLPSTRTCEDVYICPQYLKQGHLPRV